MGRKSFIDPYEPCFCESGKKYKFCCYKKESENFRNVAEAYTKSEKEKKKYYFCLCDNEKCSKKIIKSHSIQNNGILSRLSVDNHVYAIRPDFNKFGCMGLKKISRNEASTSRCFCSFHDSEIFKDIDTLNYSGTIKQNFLYAYRAFSKSYFGKYESKNTQIYFFKRQPREYSYNENMVNSMRGVLADIKDLNSLKNIFNNSIDNDNYDIFDTVSYTFNFEILFAAAYICPVRYDFCGNEINNCWSLSDKMKNIYVSIFPEDGKSHLIISWLKSESKFFEKYKKQLEQLFNDEEKLFRILNVMIPCQCDNIVLSPKLINLWGNSEKEDFEYLEEVIFVGDKYGHIGERIERAFDKYNAKFNLFLKLEE